MNPFSFRNHCARAVLLVSIAAAAAAAQAEDSFGLLDITTQQNQIVTYKGTDTFANFVGGVELNGFVGAKTFYNNGYTGTRATIANVEGGVAFTGHEMTSKISQVFYGTGALSTAAAVQVHATECSSMTAGYDPTRPYDGQAGAAHSSYSTGIAYGANLWSGNIALTINSSTGSFTTSTNSVFTGYYNALIGGVNGSTANIVTSSWGATGSGTGNRNPSAGLTFDAITMDSIVSASNKLIVFAAGNNGLATGNTIGNAPGSPAGGNNTLVVGASGINGAPTGVASFTKRADFSATGPSAAFVATTGQSGTVINEATALRARVDILAPGQGIIGAYPIATNYSGGDGTSFATPIVAGGAALIEDAGQARGYTNITDNRVVTAILQTSADKLAGWTNNTTLVGGVASTTQALDFEQGAGQMNLDKAYSVLTSGTHDVLGTGGGVVGATGWDLGALSLGGSNDYILGNGLGLVGGSTFTSTLRFNSGTTYGTLGAANAVDSTQLQFQYLSNFSLELLSGTGPTATLLASSNAAYITSEHFQFTVPTTGLYTLRVNYLNDVYNLTGHGAIGYGLAWMGTAAPVPEPASFAALGIAALAVLRRRRKA